MPSVCILTGSHLCHNPRVIKEARALQNAGYDVEVLGGWFDPTLKARDQKLMAEVKFQFRPLHDLTVQPLLRFCLRVQSRLANAAHANFGCQNHWQLGCFASSLTRAARHSQAQLLIAHSEPALWAISQLQRQKTESREAKLEGNSKFVLSAFSFQNFRIGVDMEDWFSEDLPPDARRHRPVGMLRQMEQQLLHGAPYSTCTSQAMSQALAKEYGCRPPTVIYNAFPWADRQTLDGKVKDRRDPAIPSLHWYSQTLGRDRGLDDLFAALPNLKQEFEIHLRGNPAAGFEAWMNAHVPDAWRKRIFIHPLVSNDELLSRIAEHDVGFAGEQKFCRSRDLTVTNKILHYLLAGLAVVASDTTGQTEIAKQAREAVVNYPAGDPLALAARLDELLGSPQRLLAAKAAALRAAETSFCWERQAPVLLESVKKNLLAGMSITLQINLSAGDLRYAELTVPALIKAHRANVERVLLTVDCCKPQRTKIVDPETRFPEPEFSRRVEAICALAKRWEAGGLCTDLHLLQPGDEIIPVLQSKYLRNLVKTTHDYGGCGLLSYLAGFEIPRTRYVLHYDADILLFQKAGYDWAHEALDLMGQSDSIVAAIPRGSPPLTDERRSMSGPSLHAGRPLTIATGGWLNDWFSTRCLLLDRERLSRYLPLVRGRLLLELLAVKLLNRGYPRSPEIMLFRTVGGAGGRTLILSSKSAWMLHPATKPDSYIKILPEIMAAVRAGNVPEAQLGYQDLDLEAWQRFLSPQPGNELRS